MSARAMGKAGMVYRWFRATLVAEPDYFSWVREGRLAASGRPASKRQVTWLKAHGVTAILTLTEAPLPPGWTEGLDVRHIPFQDRAPPDPERMREAADYIASTMEDGKVVLVHCLAGKGRTGCALAAYMVFHEGRTPKDAVHELRQARPGSVERAQETVVLGFDRALKERREPREKEGQEALTQGTRARTQS